MARWIVISNRLPFKMGPDGSFASTSGGLVTAIGGIHPKGEDERIWVGGAPEGLTHESWSQRPQSSTKSMWRHVPVFMPPTLYDDFYNGFCNDVLWPLLHYQNDLVRFSDQAWNAYMKANEIFASAILDIARPDDLVWIHDFHLFLLPELLRRARPELRIGFFLHVPFPNSEVFRQLPVREAILESLLACDLVGFHDYSYLHHFCSSLSRILGIDSSLLSVKARGRLTRLGVFPVSIDMHDLRMKSKSDGVSDLQERYRKPHFLFLGVDRLDYIKGLDLKLNAFQRLLEKHPEVRGKVSLLQVAVPTREGVPEFIRLHQETNRLIGEINGSFSRPDWTPVHYIYNSVNTDELIALYKAADALIVSSKRDGMNLVALEYIAVQTPDHPGVVLLSEFTGALSMLSHTLQINPWNIDDSADKMKIAMEIPKQEKTYRLKAMTSYLERYTSTDWAQSFIHELATSYDSTPAGAKKFDPTPETIDALAASLAESSREKGLALLLDYDGTLVPIEVVPELAVLPSAERNILREFETYPWLKVLILSGRHSRFLSEQFAGFRFALGSEHGASFFDPETSHWQRRIFKPRTEWYPSALKMITDYTLRVPHSRIEKKHFSIAWHYRQSPAEYAAYMAKKLAEELEIGLANLPVTIIRGNKVIEVRTNEADKGSLTNWFLESRAEGAFPLALGDDRTDEDMFRAIKGRGLSIRVGGFESDADWVLERQSQVLPFLQALLSRIDRLR